MKCARCNAEGYSTAAAWCTKCGSPLGAKQTIGHRLIRAAFIPFRIIAQILAAPVRARRERLKWLAEADGPDSPIHQVPGLSDTAKRAYMYLADVTYRFGHASSRIRTVAHVAGVSESTTRKALRELERHGLISHTKRITWHAQGANEYLVKQVQQTPSKGD